MNHNQMNETKTDSIETLWNLVKFQDLTEETSITFQSFIYNDADINFVNTAEDSNTLLHMTVLQRKKEWLQLLVVNGADQDIKNINDKTAIDLALELMNHDAVQILRPSVDTLIQKLNNYLQVCDGLKNSNTYFEKTLLKYALSIDSVGFLNNFFAAIEAIPKLNYAKMLLPDDSDNNLFAEVVFNRSSEVTNLFLDFATKTLDAEDLKHFLFGSNNSLLYMTVIRSVQTYMRVWKTLEQVLTPAELKKVFKDQNVNESIFLQLALTNKESAIIEYIFQLIENLFDLDEAKTFLMKRDFNGHTILHLAIQLSNHSMVEKVLYGYQSNLDVESMKTVLLSEIVSGQNILQYAVVTETVTASVVDKILMTAVEVLSPGELRTFVTSEDLFKQTLLHITAGRIVIFAIIWQFVSNILSPDEIKDFMLVKAVSGFNFFGQLFAMKGIKNSKDVEEYFLGVLDEPEISVLLDLHFAENAVKEAKRIESNPFLMFDALNGRFMDGDYNFHFLLRFCTTEVLKKLFSALKRFLIQEEIFILASLKDDSKNFNSFHYAAKNCDNMAVSSFWNFSNSVLSNDECNQIIIDSYGMVFHEIALKNPKLLLELIDYVSCSDPSVLTEMYCERDSEHRTLIHVVAQHFDKDLIDSFFAFIKKILSKDQFRTMLLTKGAKDQNCFKYVGKNVKEGAFDAFLDNMKMVLRPEDLEKLVLEGSDE